jgi:sterol 24-C-methyltransferase
MAATTADQNFINRLRQKQIAGTVEEYEQFFEDQAEARQERSDVVTNDYYDLVTDFYEYGWARSFHFAQMFKGSSFIQSITRHEDFLALKLQLDDKKTCLDVGCGVGGPMREIARFSGCNVVGLNNNEYQIRRCDFHTQSARMEKQCKALKVSIPYVGRF